MRRGCQRAWCSKVAPLDDLEAMTDGVASPFWALFSAHVHREWGPAGLLYQQSVRAAAEKGGEAVVELQKVLFAQEAIVRLMRWPVERQAALTKLAHVEVSQGRRGGI